MNAVLTGSHAGLRTDRGQAAVLLLARLLVAPLFIYSGIGKLMAFSATAARLPGGESLLGYGLATGGICVELGGALLLILGLRVGLAASGLILFTAIATLMFHQFWAVPPPQVGPQTNSFLKNLGLIGGLGMIAAFGPGRHRLNLTVSGRA